MLAPPRTRLGAAIAAMIACAACNGPEPLPPLPEVDLGAPLGASRSDPILLTFAATRARTRYLEDQGYTLAWDDRGVPSFSTQNASDFGVALEIDGALYLSEEDFASPFVIDHTASDAVVIRFEVDDELTGEIRFTAATSRVASLEVRVKSAAVHSRQITVLPWVRRCGDGFTGVATSPRGASARHAITPDPLLAIVGPGTFLTDFADGLAGDEPPVAVIGAASCDRGALDDLGLMVNRAEPPPSTAALVALRFDRELPPKSAISVRAHRAVIDGAHPENLDAEIDAARALDTGDVLREGKARLDAIPALDGLSAQDALVYRSSFALLDQVTMPAEGLRAHETYVFSREPTWWFARLGQNVHESLAMILLAHLDPATAVATQRNFIDRVEPDGYLPYSIGPVVEQTAGRTAAAPLFSFEAWELHTIAHDPSFLADAYEAGKKLHDFWVKERDVDQDGLAEWGGVALTESLRDLNNVVWTEVAPPHEVEAVDLNAMLVMEEKSLAKMAEALGKPSESAAWTAAAEARAAKINATMWDEATGFYYHVARDTNSFTYKGTDDLKRMEIAGLLPLWAGIVPDDRRAKLLGHLADPALFLRTYGLASLAASDTSYDPRASSCCRWNGPVWVPWQWLIWRGLRAYGEKELADEVEKRTRAAVTDQLARYHQFRELYDPDDASAPNDSMPNYLWSAMAALMMIEGRSP
jgi:hypothetical protein